VSPLVLPDDARHCSDHAVDCTSLSPDITGPVEDIRWHQGGIPDWAGCKGENGVSRFAM